MTVLELQAVARAINGRQQLAPLSLALQAGEILGIAGPNGAGKSTLLRLGCGEYRGSDGRVLLHGEPLAQWAPRARARQLAYMPQQSTLQFDLTVRQVVALGRAPHDDRAAECEQAIAQQLQSCDLQALADRSYTTLSGGEKQRVHLARVLAQLLPAQPESDLRGRVLLLDEPTSAMDIPHQEFCLAGLRALRDRGCAIMLVMHDINRLQRECDRLLLLRGGRLQALGETADLITAEQLSALYDYPLKVVRLEGSGTPYVHVDA